MDIGSGSGSRKSGRGEGRRENDVNAELTRRLTIHATEGWCCVHVCVGDVACMCVRGGGIGQNLVDVCVPRRGSQLLTINCTAS